MAPGVRRTTFTAFSLALLPLVVQPQVRGERGTQRLELAIVATTDIHGRVRAWDYYDDREDSARGLTRVASIVDSLRKTHAGRVLLVDAGDFLQGTAFSLAAARDSLLIPHPTVAAMNAMGYDAAALGNHEFDFGLPMLERVAREARFPLLAANAQRPNGTHPFPAYRIVERAGLRIAIVGATQPGAAVWNRHLLQGRLTIGPIVPAVRRAVTEARRAGADVTIAVLHSGLDEPTSYDPGSASAENVVEKVAREVPGLDLVVFGHTHRELAGRQVGRTMVVQPPYWASGATVTTLALQRITGQPWRVVSRRSVLVRAADWPEHPSVVAAADRGHRAALAYARTVIGRTSSIWRADSARVADTPIVDFILEVQRRAAGAQLASTAAFDLAAKLDSGPITVAHLARLYPYENTLKAVRITGRQLREYLEHSARYFRTFDPSDSLSPLVEPAIPGYNFDIVAGVDYVLDLTQPPGARVVRLDYRGRQVADSDTFTLALNSYRQSGAGGFDMLRAAPVVYDRQESLRELLVAEVARRGTIEPTDYFRPNWRIVPEKAVGRAYREMLAGRQRAEQVRTLPPVAERGAAHLRQGRWLRVISINDFHGALEPRRDANGVRRGGAAALAAYVARARAECRPPACTSILLDGGDEFQGSAVSNLAYGRPVVKLFERLGVAAAALGNHEFDWGQDTLRARMRDAPYAILAANVLDSLGRDVPWIRDDTVVSLGTVRVGIVGAATVTTPSVTRPSYVADLRFADPAPVVDARARDLRRRGADAVVVVAHAGAFCQRPPVAECSGEIVDLAMRVRERVDAIVSGHTHSAIATTVRGIPILQARSYGSAIGVADIPLDPGYTPVVELRDVFPDSIVPDPEVDSLVRALVEPLRPLLERPVARIAERMAPGARGTLGNLIADAQRSAGSADLAVMNVGGVRAPLDTGLVTYGSLFEVQPFGNRLVKLRVRGSDIRAYLERILSRREINAHLSGATVVYDSTRQAGRRIVSVTLSGGRSLDDTTVYSVVMNDFMAAGGDGLGLGAAALSSQELNLVDLDALIAYLQAQPQPVLAPRDPRWVLHRP